MLGQYVFAGMKLDRLLFIAIRQHALFHPTTCPVLNSWEYQRTGCTLCATKGSPPEKPKTPSMSDDTTKEVVKLDTAICICSQKAMTCMNYKHMPNNAKTTWICPNCSVAILYDTKTKIHVKVANSDSVKTSSCNSVSRPNNGNLNNCR